MGPTYVKGEVTVTSSGGEATLDLSKGNVFFLALTEDITALHASNVGGKSGQQVSIIFQQGAVARTVTPDGTTIIYPPGGALPQSLLNGFVSSYQAVAYNGVLYVSGHERGPIA